MFTQFKITHKSGKSKLIEIDEYSVRELNAIALFYDKAKDYKVERQ